MIEMAGLWRDLLPLNFSEHFFRISVSLQAFFVAVHDLDAGGKKMKVRKYGFLFLSRLKSSIATIGLKVRNRI